ncbi:MAG: 5'-methylthioadenosine/adenosylhomocysteine nucleosidase [Paraclostridium sp.]
MIIGIIGAMDVEIALLKERLELIREEEHAGFRFFVCKYKKIDVIITSCSIGKVNASCCTQIMIDKFNVNKIINTGIAGSLDREVKLGDTVISDRTTYHDVRKIQMKNWFPFTEEFTSDEELKNIAIKAYQNSKLNPFNYHVGKIVTGEAFIEDRTLKESIIKEHNPKCVEMEGGAISHVAHINKIPFVIIRSISDNADDEAEISYNKFESIASNNSATLVINMLEILNR